MTVATNRRVLFIDDEPRVLEGYRRNLRKRFEIDIAPGGPEGLDKALAHGPYAVVVADMRMPVLDGLGVLTELKRRMPDTVRMMLTGNADQQTAIDAVNEGEIFRFLNKPCPPELVARALEAGVEQHRLIVSEREMLEQTVRGSIQALVEVLTLVSPAAFGRTDRVRHLVRGMARTLGGVPLWRYEMMAMVSQLGCVTLAPEILEKMDRGEPLSPPEAAQFDAYPARGAELIAHIPRLEEVAEAVRYQERGFAGSGPPSDGPIGEDLPLGSRILKAVLDFDRAHQRYPDPRAAIRVLLGQTERYDGAVLKALVDHLGLLASQRVENVPIHALADHMTLGGDVVSSRGVLLVAKGQLVTPRVRELLARFRKAELIPDAIPILMQGVTTASDDEEGQGPEERGGCAGASAPPTSGERSPPPLAAAPSTPSS